MVWTQETTVGMEGKGRTDERSRKLNQQDSVRVRKRKVGIRNDLQVCGLENY